MNNKDRIKYLVSRIICNNPHIIAIINDVTRIRNQKFLVQLNCDNQSFGSKNNGQVILGLGNFKELLKICNVFCRWFIIDYIADNTNVYYTDCSEICVDMWDFDEKTADDICCLYDDSSSLHKDLIINALAYTIYHEFGHVKYDEDNKLPIENELKADLFAMDLVKNECLKCSGVQTDKNLAFLGAFIDSILILCISDPRQLEVSMSHPHPIERMYNLLEYFHVDNDSYLWAYSYDMISKWIADNDMFMSFEKDSSKTKKDKFLDAYLRFK